MRAHEQRKEYKKHLRDQTLNGYITDASGNWRSGKPESDSKDMAVFAGTRGKQYKQEHKKSNKK